MEFSSEFLKIFYSYMHVPKLTIPKKNFMGEVTGKENDKPVPLGFPNYSVLTAMLGNKFDFISTKSEDSKKKMKALKDCITANVKPKEENDKKKEQLMGFFLKDFEKVHVLIKEIDKQIRLMEDAQRDSERDTLVGLRNVTRVLNFFVSNFEDICIISHICIIFWCWI